MAEDKIEIPDLPPVGTVLGNQLTVVRAATGDKKASIDEISDYVVSQLTPAEILNLVKLALPQVNGLNSQFVGGLSATDLRNASNLNLGSVPLPQLPTGLVFQTATTGGFYPSEGSSSGYLGLPSFWDATSGGGAGGERRVAVQMGYTNFVVQDTSITVNFPAPFSSGFGLGSIVSQKPIILITPECRHSEWPAVATSGGAQVELDIRLTSVTLNGFTCASRRSGGSDSGSGAGSYPSPTRDVVRGHWLAIGFY